MTDTLITILSRKGSRGCPGKHTRNLCNKPLIVWTMEQAIEYGKAEIIVSSDDEAVHELAQQHDIHWTWQRPKPTDRTAKVPAIREALKDAEAMWNQRFRIVIDLDATAPLRTVDDINGCLFKFFDGWDCVLSATVGVGRSPYWNLLEFTPLEGVFWAFPPQKLQRSKQLPGGLTTRQEAPTVYEANSSIYVYRRDFLLREDVTSPLDGNCGVYVMPDESFYHIDNTLDFFLVEKLMERRLKEQC